MDIVEFLKARIDEEESSLVHVDPVGSPQAARLAHRMLVECARKRAVLDYWKRAAEDEGIIDPADARGSLALARRAMLNILAAGYEGHPDYSTRWSPGPGPGDMHE